MKIIAIGRNYTEHIKELANEKPESPVVFIKPDTALLRNNDAFYYPEFSKDIHYEVEIVLKINREGKYIDKDFAHKYFDEVGIGIDFTARDLQNQCKAKGLPWEIAKAFNHSAPISKFVSKTDYDLDNLHFSLLQNGVEQQSGNTSHMLFSFHEIITYVSRFFTLKKGDLIFTGTPAGVGPISVGDHLEAFIEGKKFLDVPIK